MTDRHITERPGVNAVEEAFLKMGLYGRNHQDLRGHVTDWYCHRSAWLIQNCRNRPGFRNDHVN